MNRDRAYYRKMAWRKARRKARIWSEVFPGDKPLFDNLHQYSKNTIHCSCPDCNAKTRNKGRRSRGYSPTYNPTVSDLRKIINMLEDLEEYFYNE